VSDRRLKVLLVHSTLHIGGAEEVSANIGRRIDQSQFDLHACFLKEKGVIAEKMESEGVTVHAVGRSNQQGADYFTSWRLRKLIAREKFDIIHSHDVHSLVDSSLCRIALPGLRHAHTFHFGNYPQRAASFRRMERAAWRVPDRLIAVSEHQRQGIRALYPIPDNRISTVWNGVDVLPALPPIIEIEKYRNEGRIIIGSVNTLIEQKGMADLIRVAQKLKERNVRPFVFLVAGGGQLFENLVEDVNKYGLQDEVIFLDWVKQAPQSVIPHIDIFFQPSLWEAMSIVLLESMALGRAIVATAVGETPRIIEDGKHGYVIKPGDISAMTDALEKLVTDAHKRIEFGRAAEHRYKRNFTAVQLAERYQDLYQDICS